VPFFTTHTLVATWAGGSSDLIVSSSGWVRQNMLSKTTVGIKREICRILQNSIIFRISTFDFFSHGLKNPEFVVLAECSATLRVFIEN
jgi:hypothetical protein